MNQQPPKKRKLSKNISSAERGVALALALVVLVTLIVLVLNPRPMDSGTLAIVRFLAATFAGISGYLFSGNLGLEARLPWNKMQIRATGAFASFVLVLSIFYIGLPSSSDSPSQNQNVNQFKNPASARENSSDPKIFQPKPDSSPSLPIANQPSSLDTSSKDSESSISSKTNRSQVPTTTDIANQSSSLATGSKDSESSISSKTNRSQVLTTTDQASPKPTFVCKTIDGIPATVFNNSRQREIILILWVSSDFGAYPPQKRCEEVSRRFEKAKQKGILNHIVQGKAANYQALCASKEPVSSIIPCTEDNLLMILRPSDDPQEIIRGLNNSNLDHSIAPLKL